MISYEIVSVICGGPGPKFPPAKFPPAGTANAVISPFYTRIDNTANLCTPCECYQNAYLNALSPPKLVPDVLIYAHDDIEIFDPDWLPKVLSLFESNPKCAVAGLGGATELGREGLYKRPYRISDMARGNYASKQRDWSTHGNLLHDSRRVAVVDAFFIAVRTGFLHGLCGWPVNSLSHHCLDLWLGCEAAQHDQEVWSIGIDCMHYGGGTSTKPAYREAKWLKGGTLVGDHEKPHKWLHDTYKDVLPIRIKA